MKTYNKYTFFYATRSPFSNWHKARFVDDKGVTYSSSEQYMMYQKAMLFGDLEIAEQILATTDPKEQKALGRMVKGFDPEKWNAVAKQTVLQGCRYKFQQNPQLMQKLLATHGTLLVEAAANDSIWGIGLAEDDPLIYDPKNWKGTNWLGEVLTQLREEEEHKTAYAEYIIP